MMSLLQTAWRFGTGARFAEPAARRLRTSVSPGGNALDELSIIRQLQTTLEHHELLRIFSRAIGDLLAHDGMTLIHPDGQCFVGDVGFFTADWPLLIGGRSIATLRIHTRHTPCQRELEQFARFVPLLAHPINNALICERLKRHAREDALTGLLNRAALKIMLPREISLARREERPMSVLMLDLDRFKQINDTCGHAVGDQVLVAVAEVLRKCLRQSDLAFRYGGEEFVIVLPDTPAGGAREAAERIREAIRRRTVPGLCCGITAIIGVAAVTHTSESAERLIARADQALYQAKAAGRDRVMAA